MTREHSTHYTLARAYGRGDITGKELRNILGEQMKLSQRLSDIFLGKYWDDLALRQAIKSPLVSEEDRILLKWYAKGIRWETSFHDMQEISVKLFNLGV